MALKLKNKQARRLWLASQGLEHSSGPRPDAMEIIRKLGFVQLDTIQNVVRAHHHIIWSRNQSYREPVLETLLAKDRLIFEHFTHDASVLPIELYPLWRRQFRRLGEAVRRSAFHKSKLGAADMAAIKTRISTEGPLSTRDFDTKVEGVKEMWARPPHKKALDCMWYGGELATSHRQNFTKFYDLPERVIPSDILQMEHSDKVQIDWLCDAALGRLAFATPGEIQRFWAAVGAAEVKAWVAQNSSGLVPVMVENDDGSCTQSLAQPDIEQRLDRLLPPSQRMHIINPFDPSVRDRARLARLFGFVYRNEMFVPARDRQWGYYVYPLLQGDRFVGRIEIKADRKAGALIVHQLWKEPGVKWTPNRAAKLDAELARFGRLIGAANVNWICASTPI